MTARASVMRRKITPERLRRLAKSDHCRTVGYHKVCENAANEIDRLRVAAEVARRIIRLDRETLYECHLDPKAGDVIDAPGLAGLKEYDAALALLDAALTEDPKA